ncbi:CorA metal ion transporter [Coemansia brasiliensis]|uniref:CorA metal ion transporter n=1 Tax=Coemansia brasiliensis TaxID=2650707 RepID=A0A9W8I8G9_9FUNG|nr:CorA metal ion transporter [Coemansia brasiliensis]
MASLLETNRQHSFIDAQSLHAWGTDWDLFSQSSVGVRSSLVDTSSWFLQQRQCTRSRIQSIAATGRDSHYCNSFFADSELVPGYSSTSSSIHNGKAGAIDIECSISVADSSVEDMLAAAGDTDELPAADGSQTATMEVSAPMLSSDKGLDPCDSSVLWIQHNAKHAAPQCSTHWEPPASASPTNNVEMAPSQVMFYTSQTGPVYASSLQNLASSGVDLESWAAQRPHGPAISSKPCFWLDVGHVTLHELHQLGRLLDLHPLTMEDIEAKNSSRDKIDTFRDYLFIVVHSAVQRRRNQWQHHYKYCRANSSIRPVTSKEKQHASHCTMPDYYAGPMASSECTLDTGSNEGSKAGKGDEQLLIVLKDSFIVTFHTGCQQHVVSRVLQRLTGIAEAASSMQGHSAANDTPEFDVDDELAGLADYSAYIAYALLDEVTDQLLPEIATIEEKVDAIDELVLLLTHAEHESVLQQMGEQRRHILHIWRLAQPKSEVVAALKRLLTSNKPGGAKQSSLGLASSALAFEVVQYLCDVQEHLLVAVDACSRAETVLARSHSNYLAKISLELSRAQVDSNATTERWTMLGTIVVPINIVTSFLGVNLKVPGQDRDDTLNFFVVLACILIYTAITLAFWRWRRIV